MKRGAKPKPTVKKILHGNPGRRPLNKKEPKPDIPDKVPRAPHHLDKIAQKEWRRMAKELYPIGLLTNIDLTALAAYCVSFSTWMNAQQQIQKHGVLIKAQSGFPMQSPYLAIANRAMTEMRKWMVEFGLTPSSRSKVEANPIKPESALEKFQKKGRKLEAVK